MVVVLVLGTGGGGGLQLLGVKDRAFGLGQVSPSSPPIAFYLLYRHP